MPAYMWGPSGGYRVVYEYANQFVSRGHEVTVVHPRRLNFIPPAALTLRQRLRKLRLSLWELASTPTIDWHPIDQRVRLLYVPSLQDRHIPDGDVLFATAWNTVPSVLRCSEGKGEKFYLIQGYESWMGPKEMVDQTWREPITKIVISRWLLELGKSIGAHNLTHIPIAIDHSVYRVTKPIPERPRQVVMALSWVPIKGSQDGIKALEIVKRSFPDLRVAIFSNSRRPPWVPSWMTFSQNPDQHRIVEDFYNGSSIFLSPSLTEGFPLPPAEAAACGCAIVATDIPGHREYLQNDLTALLSPPEDPEVLARNLCQLLADDDLRITLAQSANGFIKQFNWEQSADLLEQFMMRSARTRRVGRPSASPVEVSPV